jgi:prepilin-type N-terminal cleavage/methylation domain-containing protein
MKAVPSIQPGRPHPAGFTLIEILLASTISTAVALGVITTFVWCATQAGLCSKMSWSQSEAMHASAKLTMYLRNASEIVAIDEVEGMWVHLRFPDGSIGQLVYSNSVPDLRDGQLYLVREDGTETLVARGVTEIQDSAGYTTPVFFKTRDNAIRVSYRVAEPVSSGERAVNDGKFAVRERIGVCLRNVAQ